MRRTLDLCLKKDPRQRIADIRDVRLALEGQFETADAVQASGGRDASAGWRRVATIAGAALAGAAIVGLAGLSVWPEPEPKPVKRFVYALPEGQSFTGTNVASSTCLPTASASSTTASAGYASGIWRRSRIVRFRARTMCCFHPIFSPDGQSIAFLTASSIYRMPATGGAAFGSRTDRRGTDELGTGRHDTLREPQRDMARSRNGRHKRTRRRRSRVWR